MASSWHPLAAVNDRPTHLGMSPSAPAAITAPLNSFWRF